MSRAIISAITRAPCDDSSRMDCAFLLREMAYITAIRTTVMTAITTSVTIISTRVKPRSFDRIRPCFAGMSAPLVGDDGHRITVLAGPANRDGDLLQGVERRGHRGHLVVALPGAGAA